MQQAEIEIEQWLRGHLEDASGALQVVLHRHVKASELLLNGYDRPLIALAAYCRRVLDSDYVLKELVRDADVEWGRLMVQRPHFEKGSPGDPEDPYTAESVRKDWRGSSTYCRKATSRNSPAASSSVMDPRRTSTMMGPGGGVMMLSPAAQNPKRNPSWTVRGGVIVSPIGLS
jgi:hypothetical protein